MKATKKSRIAAMAIVAASATLGLAGTAQASSVSQYCGHGTGYGYEHRAIIYQGHRSVDGQHQHLYKHDVDNWFDHEVWQAC